MKNTTLIFFILLFLKFMCILHLSQFGLATFHMYTSPICPDNTALGNSAVVTLTEYCIKTSNTEYYTKTSNTHTHTRAQAHTCTLRYIKVKPSLTKMSEE